MHKSDFTVGKTVTQDYQVFKVQIFNVRFFIFLYSPFFPMKMLATDAKTQKIEPDPNVFYDRRMFWRQCD